MKPWKERRSFKKYIDNYLFSSENKSVEEACNCECKSMKGVASVNKIFINALLLC